MYEHLTCNYIIKNGIIVLWHQIKVTGAFSPESNFVSLLFKIYEQKKSNTKMVIKFRLPGS